MVRGWLSGGGVRSVPDHRVRDGRRGAFWEYDAIVDYWLPRIGGEAFAVYTILCRHADQDGRAFPSTVKMAERLGWSRTTVYKALRRLNSEGLILIRERKRETGKGQ